MKATASRSTWWGLLLLPCMACHFVDPTDTLEDDQVVVRLVNETSATIYLCAAHEPDCRFTDPAFAREQYRLPVGNVNVRDYEYSYGRGAMFGTFVALRKVEGRFEVLEVLGCQTNADLAAIRASLPKVIWSGRLRCVDWLFGGS